MYSTSFNRNYVKIVNWRYIYWHISDNTYSCESKLVSSKLSDIPVNTEKSKSNLYFIIYIYPCNEFIFLINIIVSNSSQTFQFPLTVILQFILSRVFPRVHRPGTHRHLRLGQRTLTPRIHLVNGRWKLSAYAGTIVEYPLSFSNNWLG